MRRGVSRWRAHPRWWTRSAVASAVVGLVLLAVGQQLVSQVDEAQGAAARERVEQRAETVSQAAAAEIDAYVSTLTLLAAALGSDPIDRASFEAATAPLAGLGLGGATSIVYLVGPVADAEVQAVQRRWRDRGAVDLTFEPTPQVDEHVFSVFSRPLDGSSQRRTGIDVVASGPPATALAEARRSGAPAVSSAYQLIIDQQLPPSERQTSFSLTVPVRSEAGHLGWVLMGLRGEDFLGSVLEEAAEGVVHVDLHAADQSGRATRVASSGPAAAHPDLTVRRELRVAQASWQLTVSSGRSTLLGPGVTKPVIARVALAMLAGLVALLVWLLLSRTARTRIEVAAATSDLARSETRAREQAALLRTVLDAADTLAVVVVDEQGDVVLSSPGAVRLFGDTCLVPGVGGPDDRDDRHPLVRALRGESCDGVELVLSVPGRTDPVRVQVASRPIPLPDGRRMALATFRDVTDDRRQVAELAGFAGVVAHDLRNPLSVAQGFVEVLRVDDLPLLALDHTQLGTALQRLERVDAALGRMGVLIEDLLAYVTARDASYEPQPVDLDPLVADVVAECLAARPPGAPAPLVYVGSLPTVAGDAGRLQQLLTNLVQNAFKYVEPGERPVLEITAETSSEHTRIRVADRGIGVPAAFAPEVFDPFARSPEVKDSYPGTGLGLAICRRVVEAHGGRLAVVPNPGGGSVFVVDLPVPSLVLEEGDGPACGRDHEPQPFVKPATP